MRPEWLGRLLDAHGAALRLYAAQWTDAPSDIVQEAFVELIRTKRPPDQVVPWLYRVVRNRAINAARAASRRRRHEAIAAGMSRPWFERSEDAAIDAQAAAEALQSLPEAQREVVVARIWGGLTFQEIAEVVGTSASTACRRYESAIAALRNRLAVTWETGDG
jgi:RNA polymerase sigma-70 factor (ECF subfamily)